MDKIKSRSEFAKKFPGVYKKLLRENKELLDTHLPKKEIHTIASIQRHINKNPEVRKWPISLRSAYYKLGKDNFTGANIKNNGEKMYTKTHIKKMLKRYGSAYLRNNYLSLYVVGKRDGIIAKTGYFMKAVKCIDTGIIYKSSMYAEAITKINHKSISNCVRGVSKTAGGYRWAYCDEKGNVIK